MFDLLNFVFLLFLVLGSCFIFSFLWLILMIKKLLFFNYLWQLKEYHFLRFIDHFKTYKARKIVFNPINLLKIISIFGVILVSDILAPKSVWFLFFLFLIYLIEACFFIRNILKKNLLKPVLTFKTRTILFVGISFLAFLILRFAYTIFLETTTKTDILILLLVDVLSPLLFSVFILSFQPITLIWQKQLLKKAKKKRQQFKDLIVIGITGSYGKSSTKEFLATILSQKFNVLKTLKNQNSEIGVSRLILNNLKKQHQVLICEIGAYEKGKIKQVAKVVQPKIGILTGINEQHLACFGSLKNTIKAKFELFDSLGKQGVGILNWDNFQIKNEKLRIKNYESKIKIIKSSIDKQIKDLDVRKDFILFKTNDIDFKVNLVGRQNIENLLIAITCAEELGLSWEQIKLGVGKINAFKKTMELKLGKEQVQIIDDTYSANPQGVLSALEHLKLFHGKKIIVMPCLIELGSASKEIHYKIGRKIGAVCDLAIITTKDKFEEIKKGAVSAEMLAKNILFLESPEKIFEKIKPFLAKHNVVLLESRVPEKLIKMLEK